MEIEEFASETTPVYRCMLCRWVFAPAADLEEGVRVDVA